MKNQLKKYNKDNGGGYCCHCEQNFKAGEQTYAEYDTETDSFKILNCEASRYCEDCAWGINHNDY